MRLEDRLMSVLASLFVSVPLCAMVWVIFNFILVRIDPSIYIDETYLLICITVLSVVAFISPNLYVRFIGGIFGTNNSSSK